MRASRLAVLTGLGRSRYGIISTYIEAIDFYQTSPILLVQNDPCWKSCSQSGISRRSSYLLDPRKDR